MVKFSMGNVLKLPQLLKLPELVMTFVTMLVARAGSASRNSDLGTIAVGFGTEDNSFLGFFVVYGFFFITLVQLISILLGDKSPVQDALFALFAFFFFLGVGSKMAASIVSDCDTFNPLVCTPVFPAANIYSNYAPEKGLASMCIITSVLFLVDTVFAIIGIKNAD